MTMKKRTRRKRNANHYFTSVHEQAIIDYAATRCKDKRTRLYIDLIQPAFNEMVDKIVFTYKFTTLPNIDELRCECKVWLTTILEKSLGAASKGGTTPLNDVLLYAQQANKKGFLFMDSPGYDPTSVTGQVASGCNIVTFTTGRGSCFGCKPSPSIKIASNTEMYNKMVEDMDVNAGKVISDNKSIEDVGQEIFDSIVKVASGKQSKSEAQGLGDLEFVPWQIGATM